VAKQPAKTWSQLTPGYRQRIARAVSSQTGLSQKQIRERYNRGTLGSLSAARGHAKTPERPTRARRNPQRYTEYLAKRQNITGGSPTPPVFSKRLRAVDHIELLLGDYHKFRLANVIQSVNRMTDSELDWTLNADTEDIRHRASAQVPGHDPWLADAGTRNPWFYH
jgi:hypothetical protein